jgi:hypothetical protein
VTQQAAIGQQTAMREAQSWIRVRLERWIRGWDQRVGPGWAGREPHATDREATSDALCVYWVKRAMPGKKSRYWSTTKPTPSYLQHAQGTAVSDKSAVRLRAPCTAEWPRVPYVKVAEPDGGEGNERKVEYVVHVGQVVMLAKAVAAITGVRSRGCRGGGLRWRSRVQEV